MVYPIITHHSIGKWKKPTKPSYHHYDQYSDRSEFLLEGILHSLNQCPNFLRSHSSSAQPLHCPSLPPSSPQP